MISIMPVFIPSFFFGILHEQPTIKCCDFASYPFSTPYTLTTAYIKLLKSGSELVIPFSTRFRSFRVNSFSNVFHDTILHDVPATIIILYIYILFKSRGSPDYAASKSVISG